MKKLNYLFPVICLISLIYCNKDEDVIEINASFSPSKLMILEGESVTFTDQSTGTPSAWNWVFEGGTPASSTDQNPTVVYNTYGIFDVSLTASLDNFSDIETKDDFITVIQRLAAQFDVSDSIINEGSEVSFTDSSIGSPDEWEWTFEGGTPSTSSESNPTIIYSTSGVYDVTLKITNKFESNTITVSEKIVVIPI